MGHGSYLAANSNDRGINLYQVSLAEKREIRIGRGPNELTNSQLAKDVLRGLTADQKFIPSKYFYDARGSRLFEKICLLPEYYLTRTELSLLRRKASELVDGFEREIWWN